MSAINNCNMDMLLLPTTSPMVRPFVTICRRSLTSRRHAQTYVRNQCSMAYRATTSSKNSERPYAREEGEASESHKCEGNSSLYGAISALALSSMAVPLPSLAANSGLFSIAGMFDFFVEPLRMHAVD